MNSQSYPSGPWTGFYLQGRQRQKHRQDLKLEFGNRGITGGGRDDLGQFVIAGRYDAKNGECHWTKTYVGAHDVFYRGFREGKGIWGTWEIDSRWSGGFHIWPLGSGDGDEIHADEKRKQPKAVDAVAKAVGVP